MAIGLFARALVLCLLISSAVVSALRGRPTDYVRPYKRQALQDIVTWDKKSLFVRGERIFLYSGEFHPFRLPVPGLWLDIFQKIRALGFNGVSFYVDWALVEGQPGHFRADGIFALEPFFEAALIAGIYLLARPGPYINAEVAGGGFPGWLQRIQGRLRTDDPAFLNATDLYVRSVTPIIAKAQITNGGPVILFQPENEYSQAQPGVEFPNHQYFDYVEQQYRNTGIVVPFISNDARPAGHFAPGTGLGAVDIYGHDGYPLGFNCDKPTQWPTGALPTNYGDLHQQQSPNTPYSLVEFQGGSYDPWGGTGFNNCEMLLNAEFERVFYKNDYSFHVTVLNLYMIFGGTNWGNLGHPLGYTSYDYGAAISEGRLVNREKYSEEKLQATFLTSTPSYLTATPENNTNANGSYTDSAALAVTRLSGEKTEFYVLRHAMYNSYNSTEYKLTVPTSSGNVTVPQLQGNLTLNGRDSKIHVTDYAVGQFNALYSSAEILTWQASASQTVLVVYGGPNERHEIAFAGNPQATVIEGSALQSESLNGARVLNWQTDGVRRVVRVGNDLRLYLLDRNSAYNYWRTPLHGDKKMMNESLVLRAGYLVRNASLQDNRLSLVGDLNASVPLEVIAGAPNDLKSLAFNDKPLQFHQDENGVVTAQLEYEAPNLQLPSLIDLDWKYIDSLPEIGSGYDDSKWTDANIARTPNIATNQTTPMSLYAGDYGYHTGNLLFRGHFVAAGNETSMDMETQGGFAYGMSAWLNSSFIGSWRGLDADENYNSTFMLPELDAGKPYVITVLLDNMGLNENPNAGDSDMKDPRGILKYSLANRQQSAIAWKLTGNTGGEAYKDLTRGPLNEGGLFAERQGYHLPQAPVSDWRSGKPTEGSSAAGVSFYYAALDLSLPKRYDIPLSFVFSNSTTGKDSMVSNYRAQLYVNGYQFGKYGECEATVKKAGSDFENVDQMIVNNIGPQQSYPVPEGILDYQGTNYIALSLWALDKDGAKVEGLRLEAGGVIQSGYGDVPPSYLTPYERRPDAF